MKKTLDNFSSLSFQELNQITGGNSWDIFLMWFKTNKVFLPDSQKLG